jgi:thermitase
MANKKGWLGAVAAAAVLATLVPTSAMAAAVPSDKAAISVDKVAKHATNRVLVKVKAGKDAKAIASKHGVSAVKDLAAGKSEWKVLNVPAGKADEFLDKLNADPDVELAQPDYVRTIDATPNDPSYGSQWHLPNVQAPQAWDITKGSTSRTIAIVDTGVDLNHADLQGGKLVAGYDFVNGDSVPQDDHGHGTHCAGIAAANTNNATNVAGLDWNAKIMPLKVLDAGGSGYDSDIIDAIYYAADHGANVISMSLGGGTNNPAFQSAIDYAWGKGLIIVAAAGNSNTSVKSYPAAYNNVIAVASTTSANVRSSFSNYGSWVDVAAPGSSILSLKLGGGTTTMSGTSMATPLVAGLATLAWSKNLGYTNTAVRDRIFNTCDVISGTGTYWTYGKVNAYRAVNGF